ncbi:hypothetical protein I7I53_03961 [Histoplasma capsulatum var. duboisii H88]|uniref:Uncharacterized protein n=1 Tax=Ajellomyces capsulatus (strain H88) TaxID=544711 RepID=A0A8A1LPK9_AJEC8|nr:hypothetical protein I7I53_03961 [Histoplasma capsulatum var. duboisii H88]
MIMHRLAPDNLKSEHRRIQRMRCNRKKTLKKVLYRFCIDCYSNVDVLIAEYSLAPGTTEEQRRVDQYFPVTFKPQFRPARRRSDLQKIRRKRKASLERKLRRYSQECYSDIYASISELDVGQMDDRREGWREESRNYSLTTNPDSKEFPPSQHVLNTHYPPVVPTTSENYPKLHSNPERSDTPTAAVSR